MSNHWSEWKSVEAYLKARPYRHMHAHTHYRIMYKLYNEYTYIHFITFQEIKIYKTCWGIALAYSYISEVVQWKILITVILLGDRGMEFFAPIFYFNTEQTLHIINFSRSPTKTRADCQVKYGFHLMNCSEHIKVTDVTKYRYICKLSIITDRSWWQ